MKIVVDNQLIEYSDQGSGPAVLMLHGWGDSSLGFNRLANYLLSDFRVIRIDFPGFGKSPAPDKDWFVGDYAEITSKFITKLGIKPHAIVGHSFGGRVIIKGFSEGLLDSDKVVLIGSAGVKPTVSIKKMAYMAVSKIGKILFKLPILKSLEPYVKSKFYKKFGSQDYLNSGRLKQIFLNTIGEDLLPLVKRINKSTLQIWGENDTETPVSDARKIYDELSDSRLEIIKDAGHFVHNDQPEIVNKLIKDFIS